MSKEQSPAVQRAMRTYQRKLDDVSAARLKAMQRYATDEVFSLLVDKLYRALNETALKTADAYEAVTFLQSREYEGKSDHRPRKGKRS